RHPRSATAAEGRASPVRLPGREPQQLWAEGVAAGEMRGRLSRLEESGAGLPGVHRSRAAVVQCFRLLGRLLDGTAEAPCLLWAAGGPVRVLRAADRPKAAGRGDSGAYEPHRRLESA